MIDFSIELSAERIEDSRTKEYFREVLSSYINGNYRSAVVMLWSVVICDLVYKLEKLEEIYNEPTAKSILKDIRQKQEDNPQRPDWEYELIENIKRRTVLIDESEYVNLTTLKNTRHLSAHPVLGGANLLYSPNKETARALLRNALEGVLLKPPFLTTKFEVEFITDLATQKDLMPDDESLKRFLNAKYFKNLHLSQAKHLFRTLWKLTFRTSDPDTDENRDINYRAISILYARHSTALNEYILSDKDFFSNIGPQSDPLSYLIEFLSNNPSVYGLLSDVARVPIKNHADSDINLKAIAFFLSPSIPDHIGNLLSEICTMTDIYENKTLQGSTFKRVVEIAEQESSKDIALQIAIEIYVRSANFDSADALFARFIEPFLNSFKREHLIALMKGIDENSQTYDRRRARMDHLKVKTRCDQVLEAEFDYSEYYSFYRNIRE